MDGAAVRRVMLRAALMVLCAHLGIILGIAADAIMVGGAFGSELNLWNPVSVVGTILFVVWFIAPANVVALGTVVFSVAFVVRRWPIWMSIWPLILWAAVIVLIGHAVRTG